MRACLTKPVDHSASWTASMDSPATAMGSATGQAGATP